ncbi:MAG: hypothetical protein JWQ48_3608 [Conexibacter sp.]|nr:hypothetical protein [Conexibacter sp.]
MNPQITALQAQVRTEDLRRAGASDRCTPAPRPRHRAWRFVVARRTPRRAAAGPVTAPSAR